MIPSTYACDGQPSCNDDSDEVASLCCENGMNGINKTTMTCIKKGDASTNLFVCKNNHVIPAKYACDGKKFCRDNSDETASLCCEDGVKGINKTTNTCVKKGDTGTNLFVCKNNYVIAQENVCNGYQSCLDNSDESASLCCEGGIDGIDKTTKTCVKKGDTEIRFFVCENNYLINDMDTFPIHQSCSDSSDSSDSSDLNYLSDLIYEELSITSFTCAYATRATLLAAGMIYIAALIKYKNIKETPAWLLAPLTEPIRFLLYHFNYIQGHTRYSPSP